MDRLQDQRRRARFIAWYTKTYGEDGVDPTARTRFMAETGRHGMAPISKGRVSQLFDERRSFGEQAARNLALSLGLEGDAFIRELSPVAFNAGLMLDDVTDPEQKKRIYALWVIVHQLVTTGQPVNITSAAPTGAPAAETAPKPARRSGT